MGARSPSRSAAAAEAAAIAPAQAASGRSGPRSPTPPTSQGVPRTPSLRLPPSPASSRRGIISPSGFHAPACPLPPPSPSASPLSSPCLSPSSFSFAVPRANSRENRAAAAVSSSASRGGDGGSGSGQRENLPRSMSSQWDVSSRSLRAGRNLSVSSPNRMLSTNLNLKAAMACVAADSATGAVDSATSATDSPRAGVSASAAMPSPTRNATAGSILRRGGLKRMPSLDSMSPVYATSSSPSSSPLSIHTTSNPPATAIPSEPLSEPASSTAEAAAEATGAGAAAASSTTGPPSPGLSPKGSPVPTPQLSPGPSPKGKHVRRVSFCTMPAAQPRAICRSSSFQSLGSGASAGQHSSYGRPGYQLGYLPSHYPSNHPTHLPSNLSPNYHSGQSYSAAGRISGMEEKRGGRKSQKLGNVGLSSDSGELELELRIPVPPRMPSPRLSPSPRVQRLLQHMWGELDDGDAA
ncbi:unnamed protein product [Closterium sp. Naga37s-1]|nr:unnamed protein product [Closterium sp. Naga37s-1]